MFHFVPECSSLQGFFYPVADKLSVFYTVDPQTVGHVFENRLRERRRLLEDHTDAIAQGQGVDFFEDIFAFKADIPSNPTASTQSFMRFSVLRNVDLPQPDGR